MAGNNIEMEILVVDNNSTDGSRDFFAGEFSNVKFIWNKHNVGFAKANNIALQEAKGDYILFLNPDTIVPEDCLENCLSFLDKNKDVGALGVKMIDGCGNYLKESKRSFPEPFTSLYKLVGLTRLFPHSKIFARYYMGHLSENNDQEVDVLAGAFMMIPRKVLDTVGGFDEQFFMYGEDIDLSYRIQKAGFRNYYYSRTTIIHFKGESTKKASLNYVRLFYGAMLLFVNKHYSQDVSRSYTTMIKLAIWLKGLQAGIAHFSKPSIQKKNDSKPRPILIVSTQEDYENILSMLNAAIFSKKNIRQITLHNAAFGEVAGSMVKLKELINNKHVSEVIFSSNEISVKDITSMMQSTNKGVTYKFYLKGSSAIVGSNDKDLAGSYIALQKI
jgi:GT2 family glycosyltransferase